MEEIVKLNIDYTYEILIDDITKLKSRYPFLEVRADRLKCYGKNYSLHTNWKRPQTCNV